MNKMKNYQKKVCSNCGEEYLVRKFWKYNNRNLCFFCIQGYIKNISIKYLKDFYLEYD